MLRRFKIRLTLLSSAIIGGVLVILTLLCLFLSESSVRSQEQENFTASVSTLYQNLFTQPYISHTALRQAAASGGLALWLYDSGTPLLFQTQGEANDAAGTSLSEQIIETAIEAFQIDITADLTSRETILHQEFPLRLGGSRYLCSAALIPRDGKVLGIAAAHDLADMEKRILRFRAVFLAADAAVLALLTLLFSLLTDRMLRPVEENEKKQADFVACASHELKSPLAVITSQLNAARAGDIAADAKFLDTLSGETQRLSRLTKDLLELSRADEDRWKLELAPTPLDTLLLELYEMYEIPAAAKGLHLAICLPEQAIRDCRCDGDRIRQLLVILLDNALAYTPAGGHITLSLAEQNGPGRRGHFLLSVADDGPGIPDARKQAVFDRFYRGDASRSDRTHFGLGLSIAKQIADAHRGQISITDTSGGGTTVLVTLP